MRRVIWLAVIAIFAFPGTGWCRQQGQSASETPAQASAPAPTPQKDSLAEAARKTREQRKESAKAAKVFTNDNLPTQGVSTVGSSSTASPSEATAADGVKAPAANGEKAWRDKFSALRHKLDQDQTELDVLQREASVDEVEFYNGDPMKAQQDRSTQQPLGAQYNKKVAAIDAKKKQVEADQQAISDAEDALRKAGGDSGWAR
jgi:hypothetical protein